MKRRILLGLWLLGGTFAFLYWWFNTITAIPLSETLWTVYSNFSGQQNPGVATDLEVLTVLVIGFCVSYWVGRFLFHSEKELRNRGLYRLWLLAGVAVFIFCWDSIESTARYSEMLMNGYTNLIGDAWLASILGLLTLIAVGALLTQGGANLYLMAKKRWRKQ